MKTLTRCIFLALSACLLFACKGTETETVPTRRVFLMYAAAYSNLSAHIAQDVEDLCGGIIPAVGSSDVMLVYAHHLSPDGSYNTPTNPVLFRVYKDLGGKQHRDTLRIYPDTDVSSSPEVLHKVLSFVKDSFPARSYGLLVSSHAKGWLPVGYKDPYQYYDIWGKSDTRCLAIESVDGSGIDIRDLADALPMKIDFFLMDACLMGCVEVAYELRHKCKYIVFSPTEILSNGFIYETMAAHIMNTATPDLRSICEEFFEFYNAQNGQYKAATITLLDCSEVEKVATVCKDIISNHREELSKANRDDIQAYFYNNGSDTLPWFYDLRDILSIGGADDRELADLNAALDECLLYTAATPNFFDLKLERVCGLSMYFPYPNRQELNNYYKTLSWNKATGLIQ